MPRADDDAGPCPDPGYARGLPEGVGADTVEAGVVHEDGGTALVRFSAFTV